MGAQRDMVGEERRPVALLTGGQRGLGSQLAAELARRGYALALHSRRPGAALEMGAGAEVPASVHLRDFASESAEGLVAEVLARHGRLDLLVLNAGMWHPTPLATLSAPVLQTFWQVNAASAALLVAEASEALKHSRGQIIGLSCASLRSPLAGHLAYTMSKSALSALLRAAAVELAPEVRVNGIAPGSLSPPPERPVRQPLPLGGTEMRYGDILEAFSYLLDARSVTGLELPVDGGAYLRSPSA